MEGGEGGVPNSGGRRADGEGPGEGSRAAPGPRHLSSRTEAVGEGTEARMLCRTGRSAGGGREAATDPRASGRAQGSGVGKGTGAERLAPGAGGGWPPGQPGRRGWR